MTHWQAGGSILVASSPEILMRVKKNKIINLPLARTIRREKTAEEDETLEAQLLSDQKLCVEHIILVDLGRNDAGKVTGELCDDLTCWDVRRSAFPVGTISRAPKFRAMELIDQLEVTKRGPYSGGFEGISFTGDMVIPTVTRVNTMFSYKHAEKRREWIAYLQSRAGMVADSNPNSEQLECQNRAAGLARAIDLAEWAFIK